MLHSEFLLNQRPEVSDAQGARAWLGTLPLTDARAAHHALAALLASFDEQALAPRRRLDVLETIRSAFFEVDAQYARRYAGKPVPLGEAERNAYSHAQALWQKLEGSYAHCARAAAAGDPALRAHLALCLARAAAFACERLKGALRAGQAPGGDAAAALAQYAALAREHGVLATGVPDSTTPKHSVSVAALQQRGLLIALTGAGGGLLTGRERECAFELAALWDTKLALTWLPAGLTRALTREDLPAAQEPARQRMRVVHQGGQIYFLDVTALSRSLRKRIHLLGLGKGTGELKLPESVSASGAGKLLARLHGIWCEEHFGRRYPRTAPPAAPAGRAGVNTPGNTGANSSGGTAQWTLAPCLSSGAFDALACLVNGQPFAANDVAGAESRGRFNEMFMFQGGGHMRRDQQMREAQQHFESWRHADHSAGGARLVRPTAAGARCKPGQLLALRHQARGTDGAVQLAELRWCAEQAGSAEAALEAGVEVLAQAPRVVAIRLTGINAAGARRWTAAFLCGSQAAGETLVTPPGWSKPGRTIELQPAPHDGQDIQRWLLGPQKRRGVDFEMMGATRTL